MLSKIDLLPRFRENTVVKQVSSYDRTGNNDDGFSGKYSFIRKEQDGLVIADLKGPGVIHRIWTPTPTEDIIQFYFDGESQPRISVKFIDLFTGGVYPFIKPVVGNEVGGYYCYIPIPYQKSCKVVFKGPRMQFYQIQYREYPPEENVTSFPKRLSADEKQALDKVAGLWGNYGNNIIDQITDKSSKIQVKEKSIVLKPGSTANLFELKKGGRIIGFELTPQGSLESTSKNIVLKATWDGEQVHSINSPVTDFFGYSYGKPAMKSLLMGVNNNTHYCYLPMPFEKRASIDLEYLKTARQPENELHFKAKVYYLEEKLRPDEGKLYVKWRREIRPENGKPYLMLEAEGKGHQVGTILQAQGLNTGMTLFFEGDDSVVVDGELRIHGTGSEDYFNGGWYALADRWDQGYSLPLHGALTYSISLSQTGGYRFNVSDKVSFEKSFLLTIEHGPEGNKLPVDYTSVAFYYSDTAPKQNPAPSADLLEVNHPVKMEYWTDLLPVKALGFNSSLVYENLENKKDKNRYNVYRITAANGGFAKLELEVPSEGEYLLYMSYFKCSSCGSFEVNQRQNPIKELIQAKSGENVLVVKELLGTVNIRKGTNTITLKVKNNPDNNAKTDVVLHKLFLEKKQQEL